MRSKFNVDNSPAGVEARTMDGIVFASRHEMHAYMTLKPALNSGIFVSLERQVRFPLNGINAKTGKETRICFYVADFVVQGRGGVTSVYDAKGVRTALYKLKKAWFECQYGIRIVEI